MYDRFEADGAPQYMIVVSGEKLKAFEARFDALAEKLAKLEALMNANAGAGTHKEVMTAQEVAEYTGYKPSYIQMLATKHEIPVYKPGGTGSKLFFKRGEVDQWLLRNRQATDEEVRRQAATRAMLARRGR